MQGSPPCVGGEFRPARAATTSSALLVIAMVCGTQMRLPTCTAPMLAPSKMDYQLYCSRCWAMSASTQDLLDAESVTGLSSPAGGQRVCVPG